MSLLIFGYRFGYRFSFSALLSILLAGSMALGANPALSQDNFLSQSAEIGEPGQESDQLRESSNSSGSENNNFIGNIITLKLHRKDCPYASIMAFAKRKYFSQLESGLSEGMQPCRFCLPRYEMRVHCRIVNGAGHLYSNTQSETP
jgi:hypothetical protein